jgi:hypothetical protein
MPVKMQRPSSSNFSRPDPEPEYTGSVRFSRLGLYEPALLDALTAAKPKRFFEYWGHEASLLSIDCQPLLRWRMAHALRDRGVWRQLEPFAGEKRGKAEALQSEMAFYG